nr:hypothetical protein [uncultured Chryseobacterium sp.]
MLRNSFEAISANYEDEYIRSDGQWLVLKRTENFVWQDKNCDNRIYIDVTFFSKD